MHNGFTTAQHPATPVSQVEPASALARAQATKATVLDAIARAADAGNVDAVLAHASTLAEVSLAIHLVVDHGSPVFVLGDETYAVSAGTHPVGPARLTGFDTAA